MESKRILVIVSLVGGVIILAIWFGVPFLMDRRFGVAFAGMTLLSWTTAMIAGAVAFAVYLGAKKTICAKEEWVNVALATLFAGLVFLVSFLGGSFWMAVNLSRPLYEFAGRFWPKGRRFGKQQR